MDELSKVMERVLENINKRPPQAAPADFEPDDFIKYPAPVRLVDVDTSVHPKMSTAVEAVINWGLRVDTVDATSLVFFGPYGTGKTMLARVALWSIAYWVDGRPIAPVGRFFVADDLIQRLTPGTPAGGEIGAETPLVVIDDVGAERTIPYVAADAQEVERQARYFMAINYCYDKKIPVVMTTNKTPAELATVIGGRAWDRLNEMAPKGFMIDLTGVPSYRLKESGR